MEIASATLAEIMAFNLSSEHWRNGIGTALWLRCRNDLADSGYHTVTLWVIEDNLRTGGFYEEQGFRPEPGRVKPFELVGATFLEHRYTLFTGQFHARKSDC